jgi:hypothetical protein
MMLVNHRSVGSAWSGRRGVGRNRSERHAESKRGNAQYHLETHGFLLLAYLLFIFLLVADCIAQRPFGKARYDTFGSSSGPVFGFVRLCRFGFVPPP